MLDPFLWARAQAAGQADFGVAGAAVAATDLAVGTAGGAGGRSLGRSTGYNSRSQPPAAGATSKLAAVAADG